MKKLVLSVRFQGCALFLRNMRILLVAVPVFPALRTAAQLGPPQRFDYPGGASAIAVHDLDGDGDADVLTACPAGLLWHEQTGPGALPKVHILGSAGNVLHLRLSDADADGVDDVLLPSRTDLAIEALHVNGDGTFGAWSTLLSTAGQPQDAYLADLDNDGDLDLCYDEVQGNTLTYAWAANDGSGQFGTPAALATANVYTTAPYSAFIPRDMDNDGDTDVVTLFPAPRLFLNEGGTFTEHALSGPDDVLDMQAADVDGDSDLDLWITAGTISTSSMVYTLSNNGDGTFASPDPAGFGVYDQLLINATAADADNDGDLDLYVSGGGNLGVAGGLMRALNDGTGHLTYDTTLTEVDNSFSHQPFALGYVDNDPLLDVAASVVEADEVLFGTGAIAHLNSVGVPARPAFIGQDVVLCSWSIWSVQDDGQPYLRMARHPFTADGLLPGPQALYTSRAGVARVHGMDMNGDGGPDLVAEWVEPVVGTSRRVFWMNGTDSVAAIGGSFYPGFPSNTSQPQFRDLDHDGDTDMVRLGGILSMQDLIVCLNDGTGHFGPEQGYSPRATHNAVGLAALDVDQDGTLDYAWVRTGSPDSLMWATNDGSSAPATISHAVALPIGVLGSESLDDEVIRALDMDLDGRTDIVVFSGDHVAIMRNIGGGFELFQSIPCDAYHLAFGDLDADGHLDLVAQFGGALFTRFGQSDGTLGPELDLLPNDGYNGGHEMNVGDVDGDGKADVVLTRADSYAVWFKSYFEPGSVGISEAEERATSFTAYPNPATTAVRITCTNALVTTDAITLTDLSGRVLRTLRGNGTREVVIARNGEADGVYVVRIVRSDRSTNALRIAFR